MRLPICVDRLDYGNLFTSDETRGLIAALRQRRESDAGRPAVRPSAGIQPAYPSPDRPRLADVLAHSRLPGLDGLRATGVFAVIAAHAVSARDLPGDFGPTAFFVLSGFLITRLLERERTKRGTVSIPRFYLGRTLRIFPAYYAFLLVSYLLDARAGQRWSNAFLVDAVTYTLNYFNAFNGHPTTSLAHAWSLAVEEQFYILWPLVFIILAARGRRTILVGVGLAALAGIVWRSWLILGVNVDVSYVYNAFETRFDNLAVGCLLALALEHQRVLAAAEWCGRKSWYPLVTLAFLLMSRTILPGVYHYSIGFTIDALLVAIGIVQLLQLSETRWWGWLEWSVVRYIGAISYPMYLYHAWGASIGRRLPGDYHELEFLAGVVATIALAAASYHLIELPALRLKPRRAPEVRQTTSGESRQPSVVLLPSV
jgi:peptidoglycan/LPS O-acetylase OafA/YrhL